jgi:hypothetical protein
MFNWQLKNKSAEVATDEFVFGAEWDHNRNNLSASGVVHTYYMPLGRDGSFDAGRLAWYRTYHPDWIVYQNDRQTPAWYGGTQATSSNTVPIDLANPALRDYLVSTFIQPALTTGGYQGVGFDQGETPNYFHRAGVYVSAATLKTAVAAGSVTINSSAPVTAGTAIALGDGTNMEYVKVVATSGTGPYTVTISPALQNAHRTGEWVGAWKQQYNGNVMDTAYRAATIAAFRSLVGRIKEIKPDALVAINDDVDVWTNVADQAGQRAYQYWSDLVQYADIVVEECGFTNCGVAPYYTTSVSGGLGITNQWLKVFRRLQWAVARGKGVMLDGYEPYMVTSNMTVRNVKARFDAQWNVANYLLVRGNYSYLAWRGPGETQTPNDVYMEPEYRAQVGDPVGDAYHSGHLWMRDYSTGLTVVNPSNTAAHTVTLPPGIYQDLYGHQVNTHRLPPHSGLVLVKARGLSERLFQIRQQIRQILDSH